MFTISGKCLLNSSEFISDCFSCFLKEIASSLFSGGITTGSLGLVGFGVFVAFIFEGDEASKIFSKVSSILAFIFSCFAIDDLLTFTTLSSLSSNLAREFCKPSNELLSISLETSSPSSSSGSSGEGDCSAGLEEV